MKEIRNYNEFKERLKRVVADVKEEIRLNKTTGSVIENLSGKLMEILENFSKFTPEEVEKVRKTSMELLDKTHILSSESGVLVPSAERKSRKKHIGVTK
jgi:hypothetical protein